MISTQHSTKIFPILVVALVLGATPWMSQATPYVDVNAVITLEGSVVSWDVVAGAGTPTLVVDDAALGETAVRLGPIWYLNDAGLSFAAGEPVRVVAYPCTVCAVNYVAAEVENLTTGVSAQLRDEEGYPLWIRRGRGQGPGYGQGQGAGRGMGRGMRACQGGGPDMTAVATVTGTVEGWSGGLGEGRPTLSLEAAGEQLDVLVSPYRTWIGGGIEPVPGQLLEVTYAPVLWDQETHNVAIKVTDPTSGITVELRDAETGFPVGCRGGRGQGQGRGHRGGW